MKDDLQKSDSCGLKSERKKILTSSTCSLACLSTNLGAFCPMVVHLPSEKSILPYFSGPRGVAILDCDSHSQAGSTKPEQSTRSHFLGFGLGGPNDLSLTEIQYRLRS